MTASTQPHKARFSLAFIPILQWLPHYQWRQWLRADVIAGITLWGVVVPEGMAYAGLAGLPPQAGLYTILAALVAYAIFGTSRQLVVVATSASAVMLAATLTALNPPDQGTYLALAAVLIVMIGAIFIFSGILRLGFITNFISRPVMEGFIFGLAIFIVVKQLPKLFGIHAGTGNTFEQLMYLFNHLGQTNLLVLAVGGVALVLLFVLHRLSRRVPAGLAVLVLGIIVSAVFSLSIHGVAVVGKIPTGLPSFVLPDIRPDYLWTLLPRWALLPGALGIALVIYTEGLGAANAFASKHGYEVNPNQELISYGIANLGSAVLGGMAAGGSLSQSSVNDGAGAKSSVSLLIAAAMGLITVIALTPLFTALPEAVLAAIIIYAVSHLMKWRQMQRFFQISQVEFWLGMVSLLGVLIVDVLPGLAIAVLLSLVIVIYRSSRPYGSVLGQVPGEPGAYTDIRRHPESKSIPGLLIFRFNSPLYFANATLFHSRLKEIIRLSTPPTKAVVVDMVTNDQLDITSIEMLEKLAAELERNRIEIMVAEVHQPVREMARRSGLAEHLDKARVFPTVDAAVQDFLKRNPVDSV
ncbi:MAG: SulP family inorganic anion transporter [Dehalococcoidia bacterium]|nr:SulP family inorganic anion transporter [Dehalococcoidia bacterium]